MTDVTPYPTNDVWLQDSVWPYYDKGGTIEKRLQDKIERAATDMVLSAMLADTSHFIIGNSVYLSFSIQLTNNNASKQKAVDGNVLMNSGIIIIADGRNVV